MNSEKSFKKGQFWLYLSLAIILCVAIILEVAVLVFQQKLENRVFPRTLAAQVDISYLEKAMVVEQLTPLIKGFEAEPVLLRLGNETYDFTLEELGVILKSAEEIAEEAPTVQKKNNLGRFLTQLLTEKRIDLVNTIDLDRAKRSLRLKIPTLREAGQNAEFQFNEAWQLKIVSEKTGMEIDSEKLFKDIRENIEKLEHTEITLEYKTIEPDVTAEDLEKSLSEIQRKLDFTVTVKSDDENWEIPLNDHLDWIDFEYQDFLDVADWSEEISSELEVPLEFEERKDLFHSEFKVPTRTQIRLILKPEEVEEFLATEIKSKVEIDTTDVQIVLGEEAMTELATALKAVADEIVEADDQSPEDIETENSQRFVELQAGKITFKGTAKDGRKVLGQKFIQTLELAFNEEVAEFELPIKEAKGEVKAPEELKALGIEKLIATGYSDFSGSPWNRRHNIGVGIEKYNGLLIPPGETWSFNDHLGAVNASTGYKKELVIKKNETIPEYGGGLCQVSSTFFRAVLFGGFPVAERYPHHYAVSYYAYPMGYGLDATIYPPLKDVRFINDSPGYILIQSYVEGNGAYFKFYGTDDGRTVEMDGPYISNRVGAPEDVIEYTTELAPGERKQTDISHKGFDATWYRTVTKSGEEPEKETFFSHYFAWAAKYLVGAEKEEE